jgi:hypothetical protein
MCSMIVILANIQIVQQSATIDMNFIQFPVACAVNVANLTVRNFLNIYFLFSCSDTLHNTLNVTRLKGPIHD